MEDLLVIVPQRRRQVLSPAPVHPGGFDLVVAGPQHDARMISEPLHIVDRLGANVIQKFLRRRIHAASEHEILPHEDSHFVAQLVKQVRFVNAAAPDAQHIHVAVAH